VITTNEAYPWSFVTQRLRNIRLCPVGVEKCTKNIHFKTEHKCITTKYITIREQMGESFFTTLVVINIDMIL
jgi:hypothetical protein